MNILMFIMFLLVFLSILLGGHLFLYFSLVKFLSIMNTSIKIWLGLILFVLSISFILSSILAHYSEGILARITYNIFSFWLGLGWNLTMALAFSWIVFMITRLMGVSFDLKYLVFFSFVFAFIYSAWGAWNAYHPKIKNVSVSIKNIPSEWQNKKIIQLSDVHLGHIYGKKFLNGIVGKVNQENPDIIFITGDLFDGMDGELSYLISPLNALKAKDGIYFITGNHETYLGVEKAREALKETPVQVLDNEIKNIEGMQVIGISYPERGETGNLKDKFKKINNFNSEMPSILLYHNPKVAKEARELGINLQLSGHTHQGQIFPFGIITYWVYGKYHSGLVKEGDFNIYTSVGTGTWGPMMRTSGRAEITSIKFDKNN